MALVLLFRILDRKPRSSLVTKARIRSDELVKTGNTREPTLGSQEFCAIIVRPLGESVY